MARIYSSVEALIGETPLLALDRLTGEVGLSARILAKLEGHNPAGSAKDRVALAMIEAAEAEGKLTPGGTVIEPTSGNTGIGLAAVAAARGYRAVIVMPDSMSVERRRLMSAYGAEVVLTPGALGMAGAIARAEEICAATPNSYLPSQFENPENPAVHYRTTGPELFRDTDGELDFLVAGIGTGGTITGVGRYLKERIPSLRVIGVEPAGSPVLTEGRSGAHGLQGIGAGFVPKTLDTALLDEVLTVTEAEAAEAAHRLAATEGVLAGISGGAALSAAVRLAARPECCGKRIAVILPDTGERYLSSLYATE
ncbi:MAG: cysteine synthase A [Clostridia bacterium]|nr:cysteine synthase A [Clostridia bacterium]